jgi:pimeloyl-ACP methyl ester carboxylesterase
MSMTRKPLTLILLPGMHGTADLFGPFLDVVPDDVRTRAVEYPTDVPLGYDNLVAVVERQTRDETDMVVVAESFSGPVGIRLAARHPGRVRGLVLSGTFVVPPWPSALRWAMRPFVFRLPAPAWAVRFVVAGCDVSDAYVDVVREAIQRTSPRVLARRARDALTADSTTALREVRCPVLVLQGRQDHTVPPRNAERLRRARPDARVTRLDGPHLLLQSRPAECWRLIHEFLKDCR